MSKCQAKVEKTVPRSIWGVTKKMENCPKDAKGEGFFCEVHGCFDCSCKPVGNCSEYEGVKLCLVCQGKREFKKKAEEERKKKIIEEDRKAFRKEQKEAEEKEAFRKKKEELEEQERLRKEAEEEREREFKK
ncbi:621_t:CDS:1, partial [Funneliformis geosporum]